MKNIDLKNVMKKLMIYDVLRVFFVETSSNFISLDSYD